MKPKSQRMARLLFLAGFLLLSGVAGLFFDAQQAGAYSSYLGAAETQYPSIVGTKLDSCQLCHPSGGYALNAYATDYKNAGHSFTAIEQVDSDKDGFLNITEINALTFPGDVNDRPAAAATNTPTPTKAPATATNTPTPTQVPATATNTPTPTATKPGPTATLTPTPTATQPAPTATATSTPTATQPGPTATLTPTPSPTAPVPAGPTPTTIPLPGLPNRFAFLGSVSKYPSTAGRAGLWVVSDRVVQVVETTWLEQPGLLGEHSTVWVLGRRGANGDVQATYIRILTKGEDDDDSPALTPTATRTPRPTATATATRTPTRTPRPVTATPTRTPKPTEDDDDRATPAAATK